MNKQEILQNLKKDTDIYKFLQLHNISDELFYKNVAKFVFFLDHKETHDLDYDGIIKIVSTKKVNNFASYLYAPDMENKILEVSLDKIYNENNKINLVKLVQQKDLVGKNKKGIYLYGKVGGGKTFMNYVFANMAIKKNLYTTFISFYKILQLKFNSNDNYLNDQIRRPNVLFLDDIGSENITNFYLSELFAIIDYRYNQSLTTYFTSNYSLEELYYRFSAVDEMQAKRIISRIKEMTYQFTL